MAQIQYQITFDGADKLDLVGIVNKAVFPMMSQAVRAIAAHGAADWKARVMKAKLWSVEKDAYAKSINWKMTGDFSARIESDYKYAADIETGRPARDLKDMLNTSTKVRRTEDGRRFLIIPFRHNTPGAKGGMPGSVHLLASAMAPSKIVSTGKRQSGEVVRLSPNFGMSKGRPNANYLSNTSTKAANLVTSRNYAWGGRLTAAALKNAGADAEMTRRYSGMVKMQTSTPGGAKSSAYMTFRVMMEGSKGWIVPAKSGLFLAQKTANDLQPKASAAFAQAIARQLAKG
jgi:hypothetical protein